MARTKKKLGRRTITLALEGALIGCGVGLIALAVYLATIVTTLPAPDEFSATQVRQSTKLLDRTGKVVLYELHGEEKRTVVAFEDIPQVVKDATLAAEDAEFYSEPAFNWKGIVRALIANLRRGEITQGGSTITQQLAKTIFLSPERTITRKVKELILALQLESKYTKDQILGFYLNQIPYGSNAYGVEAASQTYFGKKVAEIGLGEAATLASLIKAPSYYSPWGNHTKELAQRTNKILDRMVTLKMATEEERGSVKLEDIAFAPPSLGTIKAPHFSLLVRDYLVNKYGEDLVMNGGLKVVTTLDMRFQEAAERAVEEGVKRNTELYTSMNGALVAQDTTTGQILALVGSRDYFAPPQPAKCVPGSTCRFEGNFNVASQGLRQPGSALKPFVYMTAFQRGYPTSTQIFDVLTEFDVRNKPETSYQPHNFDNKFRGPVDLASSLAQSLNVIAVKTLYLAGLDNVLKNLSLFGITTLTDKWRYGLSLTLGGGEVRLSELVNAYATLAEGGVAHPQTIVLSVIDSSGEPLEVYENRSTRVIDAQYPRLVTSILSSKELRAPLYGSSLSLTIFPGYDVALKTGTTEDYRDAWAVGYTPSLAVGVWAGNNNNEPMTSRGSSILAAVPMWSAFMKEVLPFVEPKPFSPPEVFAAPEKPMLNGKYTTPSGVHSILYYVDKSDPLGPAPANPYTDPQFENWESAVLSWAGIYGRNLPLGDQSPGKDITQNKDAGPDIRFDNTTPTNGSYVGSPLAIQSIISSDLGLQSIEVTLNGVVINSFGVTAKQYRYTYSFTGALKPQNTLTIKAKNVSGAVSSATVVFYQRP